ncbi:MAG: cob(I)yrinic acid a,c-diamide adenosyltransferase [Candidatus Eiseniibacteriota bacterium]
MKIYTRGGDGGETSFFGGERVAKSHPRVAAYGDVDELNAALGLAQALGAPPRIRERIEEIQRALFGIGGEIATPNARARERLRGLVDDALVAALEESIDSMEEDLAPLRTFILPGGGPGGAALHVARTVCRRAERSVVALAAASEVRPEVLRYLNRLSDWLFVAARWVNHEEGRSELPW